MKRQRFVILLAVLIGTGITLWAISKLEKKEEPTLQVEKKKDAMEFTEQIPGLQYHIINHGHGETTPQPGQAVDVHYTGWLDNGGQQGTKFDSSHDRGRPFTFVAGAGMVIKGWDDTILEMREGEKRYIILVPELGYGSYAMGPIPANSKLRFEVELIKIHE